MNGRKGRILLALVIGAVGVVGMIILRPSAPLPVVETPLVEETPTPGPGTGGGGGGWQPVQILPPPPPARFIETTVDEIFIVRTDQVRWDKLQRAETVRITGYLVSFYTEQFPPGITIRGESLEEWKQIEIVGMGVSESIDLWDTCPKGTDRWFVYEAFKKSVRLGDQIMAEGDLVNLRLLTSIDRIRVRR